MSRKQHKAQKKASGKGRRLPLRAIPWWGLLGLVVVCVVGVWVGTRWGDRISAAVREVSHRVQGDPSHDEESHEAGSTQYYTCGMHPSVILPEPGDCPICHMALTPLDPSKFTGEVVIDPVVVQNIGVRIEPVGEGPLVRTIRTVGTVDYDERRVRDVNTKLSGWIEKLDVDYVGAAVAAGDPLFEVYSPELLAAQEEYLLALRRRREGAGGLGTGIDMVASARTKLELFDITPEQIEAIGESGEAMRTLTLLSPHTGVVIAKHANEGMKIDPGMQVFRIADLSKVWVLVTLYESQLPYVSVGQDAVMSLPYVPGQTFEGEVVYVYPYVDTKTREVQVRLEFDNEAGLLKPGMFTTVELRSTLRRRAVLAPREAVVSTGERDVAFVSLGEGRFEPRRLKLGVETGDGEVEILDGLAPGEMVVTSGQFLLDSESRVREALAKMMQGEMAAGQVVQAASAGATELAEMPEAMASGLAAALDAYFGIGDKLAGDTAGGIDEPARALAAAMDSVIGMEIPGHEHFWHQHTEAATARGKALELIGMAEIAAAREAFADLSVAMDTLVRATGVPPGYGSPVQSLHCPMFREGQGGGTWLQPEGSARNPFFGSMMLRCFDRRETIPVTGAAAGEEADETEMEQPAPAEQEQVSEGVQRAIDLAVAAYLEAQHHLTLDEAEGAAEALKKLRGLMFPLGKAGGEVSAQAGVIAEALADVPAELEAQRAAFGTVSDAMLAMLAAAPPSETGEARLFDAYCPMVEQHWLQAGEDIRNPYDPGMLQCGNIEDEIKPLAPAGGQP